MQVPFLFSGPIPVYADQVLLCRSNPVYADQAPVYPDPVPVYSTPTLFTQTISLFAQSSSLFADPVPVYSDPDPVNSVSALFTQAPSLSAEALALCSVPTAWAKQQSRGQVSVRLTSPSSHAGAGLKLSQGPVVEGRCWKPPAQNLAKTAPSSLKVVVLPLTSTKRSTTCF